MTEGRARRATVALRVAQLLLVVAAGGLWGASRLPWVLIRSFDGLGQPKQVAVTGASWSTALVPLAWVCLAAAVAAVAVRGWPLRALAVLMAVVSLAAGYLAVSMWVARDIALRALDIAEIPLTSLLGTDRRLTGAVLTLLAALCVLAAAALLMRAAAHDTGSNAQYATPAVRRAAARGTDDGSAGPPLSERMMWDALDEGCDPTEPPPGADPEGR
ncbi:TIGR02234 family membrane protein [Mycolicibacter terrae]|uniref:TIGR02234 family membrane protein n=1 Tax=Mycolicibacter terrae TaxID=1788 RepID=A0ACD2ESZ1_9MYCO|nr:TIGR02234 family membrane protein [Mycolicibacter terrae]RRR48269.1 TIGR02234 family membrane protein [Mycolicibacter terrae]